MLHCYDCMGYYSIMLGAADIPSNTLHSWKWCEKWIPKGKNFYAVGIAVIYWSIWKAHNRALLRWETAS